MIPNWETDHKVFRWGWDIEWYKSGKSVVCGEEGLSLVFGAGYHPHKRTFKTHPKHIFFRYENRPQIRVLVCVFLNLSIMSFPKFVNMTKNTPFFPILHVFASLNDVRAYVHCLVLKNNPNYMNFFTRWYPTSIQVPPPPRALSNIKKGRVALCWVKTHDRLIKWAMLTWSTIIVGVIVDIWHVLKSVHCICIRVFM